jgi:hypothetical protein
MIAKQYSPWCSWVALFQHAATIGDKELAAKLKLVGYDFEEGVVFVKSEGNDVPWKLPIDSMLGVIGDIAGWRKGWHQRNRRESRIFESVPEVLPAR